MFITVKNKKKLPLRIFKAQVRANARTRAYTFPLKACGMLLDQYLKKKYSTSLKAACILLLNSAKFEDDKDGVLVWFPAGYPDTIARIITYGTGEVPGSRILNYIFQGE